MVGPTLSLVNIQLYQKFTKMAQLVKDKIISCIFC